MMSGFVFQVDHPIVVAQYEEDNFKIVVDEAEAVGACAIYFSSHDIYFPNTENEFRRRILDKNSYEWFGTRLKGVRKHIYVRDIHKQWYLSGINSRINSPELLLDFLRLETSGCNVFTLGSSAGGYAAVLYGVLLGAKKIISFNGQMELNSLLRTTSDCDNPLIFRLQKTGLRKYYDLRHFLASSKNIFYIYSSRSIWDAQQASHVSDMPISAISFDTAHHGIPFLKCALQDFLDKSNEQLSSMVPQRHRPLAFSVRSAGLWRVLRFGVEQVLRLFVKRVSRRLGRVI